MGGVGHRAIVLLIVMAVSVGAGACAGSSTPTGTLVGNIRVIGGPYPGVNVSVNGAVVATGS